MENLDNTPMENAGGQPRNTIVWRNAVAVSLIYIVIIILSNMFREQVMKLGTGLVIINGVIMLAGIIITQTQVRKEVYNEIMSFSKGWGTGMYFVLGVTIITVVFGLLFNTVIAPDTLAEQKELSIQKMREQEMSKEQIEQSMKFIGFMFKPVGAAVIGMVSNLFFGLILSLVGAAVTSRSK